MQTDGLRNSHLIDIPANDSGSIRRAAAPQLAWSRPSVILAALAITICSLLIALAWFAPFAEVRQAVADLRKLLVQRLGEYLFFIGTTHLSLLLLRRGKWIKAKLMFLAGVAWVTLHEPLTQFVKNLGGDSFAEAQAFDLDEAVFWIQTLHEAISPRFSWLALACYLVAAVASFHLLRVLLQRRALTGRHYSHIKFSIAALVIGIALQQTISEPMALFIENTETYAQTKANFTNPAPPLLAGGGGIDLLVYIGESTSVMDMGIYGYPRDTTPALQALKDSDDRLLVFNNVFSTHTHTSPSLLEALSFGMDDGQRILPIHKRRRLSLVDLLAANHIRATLVSNQGQTGTWNMASTIIFNKARSIYSSDTRKLGNNDDKVRKPWDDAFFRQKIDQAFTGTDPSSRVAFFHSYSGHGAYFDNIPAAYRKPVDDRFEHARRAGAAFPFLGRVEEYDAAIRYVDHAVAGAIGYVRGSARPMVLVYFADHGDAPFAGRAHDSSQFIHEMVRVPFLIYFNDAARSRYPGTFEKYRELAAAGRDATLAQLPSTLLDLLQRQLAPSAHVGLAGTPVIGEPARHPPIVVRETAAGLSYVDINRTGVRGARTRDMRALDGSDPATRSYTAMRNKGNGSSRVCSDVDTLEKLVRSRLVADCAEVAIAVNGDGTIPVITFAGQATALPLMDVLDLAAANRMAVWINAPQLRTRAQCDTLARYLRDHAAPGSPVLVELPTGAHRNAAELGSCTATLAGMGVATSYEVPEADALPCARSLSAGRAFGAIRNCARLKNDVAAAWRSRLFTDIGFHHAGMAAMEAFREAGYFRWNAREVKASEYSAATSARFRMAVVKAD